MAKSPALKIIAPERLCIYSDLHCIEYVQFTSQLASSTVLNKRRVIADLSKVTQITAAACVMLFAETTRAQLVTGDPGIITFTLPSDPTTKKIFVNSGLWNAIRPGSQGKLDNLWKQRSPFASGTEPTKHLEATMETLKALSPVPLPSRFDSAISEAMLNVYHHAYENLSVEGASSGIGRRWWQYANVSPSRASFIICDLGIGIPKICRQHMPTSAHDGEAIKNAMREGYSTRSGKEGRGMGCLDLQRPVASSAVESLAIFSNYGIYWFREGAETEIVHRDACLPGTILEWSMKLPEGNDGNKGQ